jgi:hypothetical protein
MTGPPESSAIIPVHSRKYCAAPFCRILVERWSNESTWPNFRVPSSTRRLDFSRNLCLVDADAAEIRVIEFTRIKAIAFDRNDTVVSLGGQTPELPIVPAGNQDRRTTRDGNCSQT